ncbi:CPBP family intramembrane metalloprotease [soil metagenome]
MTPRFALRAEVWIVLGLSLGQSGVYAAVNLIAKLTRGPLRDQTATLNASQNPREYLDLTYQILGISFALVPVVLAIYLLALNPGNPRGTLGFGGDFDKLNPRNGKAWWRSLAEGAGLAALIGLPGLALYFTGRALGISVEVIPSALNEYWWTVPFLILSAAQNAILEEVVVVGYLMTRLKQFAWSLPAVLLTSAALRGSYHLYQGFGAFVGNFVMGLIFGYWFHRTKRVLPLIVAHTILDVVAFVGYALLADKLSFL